MKGTRERVPRNSSGMLEGVVTVAILAVIGIVILYCLGGAAYVLSGGRELVPFAGDSSAAGAMVLVNGRAVGTMQMRTVGSRREAGLNAIARWGCGDVMVVSTTGETLRATIKPIDSGVAKVSFAQRRLAYP